MEKGDLRIEILGVSFSITADEDPLYLEGLLNHYRKLIEDTQKVTSLKDPLKIAILAGFLLCDENEKIRKGGGGAHEGREAEQLILDMIARIDEDLDDKIL
jgi:hypothetical protein